MSGQVHIRAASEGHCMCIITYPSGVQPWRACAASARSAASADQRGRHAHVRTGVCHARPWRMIATGETTTATFSGAERVAVIVIRCATVSYMKTGCCLRSPKGLASRQLISKGEERVSSRQRRKVPVGESEIPGPLRLGHSGRIAETPFPLTPRTGVPGSQTRRLSTFVADSLRPVVLRCCRLTSGQDRQ